MIYCAGCGLFMSNGFCLHGNADARLAEIRAAREKRGGKKKGGKKC